MARTTVNCTIGSARDFWTKIAQPDYEKFQAAPTDLRKAFHAATSLYHVVDWVWTNYRDTPQRVFGTGSLTALRDHLIQNECGDFALIRDVADSSKHFRLHRSSAIVASSTNVTFGARGWGESAYGEGAFGGTPQVVVDAPDGVRHLTAITKNVHDMWNRLFGAKGW